MPLEHPNGQFEVADRMSEWYLSSEDDSLLAPPGTVAVS